ncbi:hypothetical protein R69619_07716 [Paraburkholderia nemoris]|nr:hypothetical protein R69619_07716 [Paraburkholderia nemoris]
MIKAIARLVHDLPQGHFDRYEIRLHARPLCFRQNRKQVVFFEMLLAFHLSLPDIPSRNCTVFAELFLTVSGISSSCMNAPDEWGEDVEPD